MALIVGVIFSVLQPIIGHFHTIQVALTQPAKFAAQEGLFTTQSGAPLIIFGILTDTEVLFKIEIPLLLSILTFGDPNATVSGLDAYPVNKPSVMLTFYPFHLMVFLGVFFVLFTIGGILLFWRKGLESDGVLQKWYLRIAVLIIPLPIIANELGWITTEVGRQPWIIQGILKTNDAISIVVPPEQVLFSLIMFILIFIVLFIAWLLVMIRVIRTGPMSKSEVKT